MSSFKEIVEKSLVCLKMAPTDGSELVKGMIDAAVGVGLLPPAGRDSIVRAVLNRELSASTALPDGIALPHGRTEYIDDIVCVFGIHQEGIEFGAPDGLPTHIFVLLLVPASTAVSHIHFLANLSRCLMEPSVKGDLLSAPTQEDFVRILLNYSGEGAL